MVKKSLEAFFEIQRDPFWSEKLTNFFTFAIAAQYKSIRIAAAKMCISPQALNKQITALEKKLGMTLLNRSPRGFQLTTYGELVDQYAMNLFRDAQQLKSNLSAAYAEKTTCCGWLMLII